VNYRADPDIAATIVGGTYQIPAELDNDERARIERFCRADMAVDAALDLHVKPAAADLAELQAAGRALYEQRTERLPIGWQKLAVLSTGMAAIDSESASTAKWAYNVCEKSPGWLGNFDDDIREQKPLREFSRSVPPEWLIFG
jgi:hypothetical protein